MCIAKSVFTSKFGVLSCSEVAATVNLHTPYILAEGGNRVLWLCGIEFEKWSREDPSRSISTSGVVLNNIFSSPITVHTL